MRNFPRLNAGAVPSERTTIKRNNACPDNDGTEPAARGLADLLAAVAWPVGSHLYDRTRASGPARTMPTRACRSGQEMLQRHDWVTLYVNGIRYLEKAPLMYWGVATSYTLFGISEWSTRLPLMLGVLAMILATYGLGRWTFGSEGGFRFRPGVRDRSWPVSFYAISDSRRSRRLWLTLTFWLFLVSLEQTKPSRWICWGLAAVCALTSSPRD